MLDYIFNLVSLLPLAHVSSVKCPRRLVGINMILDPEVSGGDVGYTHGRCLRTDSQSDDPNTSNVSNM